MPPPEAIAARAEARLVFAVDGRAFAAALDGVIEIIAARPATPLPAADPAVLGVLPRRGRMLTLVDARRRLSAPPRDPSSPAQVIVMAHGAALIGLVVDAVTRVGTVTDDTPRVDLAALLRVDS
jgi:purine-binding chemotaxis protein CheW